MAGSRPPNDEASDVARRWQTYTLAESDQVDELRRLAAAGDEHARRQLASWLSERAFSADAGHQASRMQLGRRLAREGRLDELRWRAESGDEYAQHWLDEAQSQF
jgi:predicted NBD/HSP70 family sugar kinase